ncbi:MAG: hypothetical protein RL392_1935 [Pseudomonadota bacterium]|jgi:hypothetical protein
MRFAILLLLTVFSVSSHAQISANQTGVPIEALQHNYDEYMSFNYSHGQLCQRTLKQTIPGMTGVPRDMAVTMNLAGFVTSKWRQDVTKPDGTLVKRWSFECVSQVRPGKKIALLALSMFEERGAEMRGVELLTNRDISVVHSPN